MLYILNKSHNFNPRTLRGVRLTSPLTMGKIADISIHAPYAGCDDLFSKNIIKSFPFQSTHPTRGATMRMCQVRQEHSISIHAPYAGCDEFMANYPEIFKNFNPRTLRGVRHFSSCPFFRFDKFQSTHPTRGATNIYASAVLHDFISIHAPYAGCDLLAKFPNLQYVSFQSTHPTRGATSYTNLAICDSSDFNPRTLRGVRRHFFGNNRIMFYFNPRTLRGVRRKRYVTTKRVYKFQSTHPTRGATIELTSVAPYSWYFNPRTLRGVRRIYFTGRCRKN